MIQRKRPEYEVLFDLYCIQKRTTTDIAKRFDTTKRTVSKWLKLYKIVTWFGAILRPDKETLYQWYWVEKKTLPEIATLCGCSYPAIRIRFKKLGIPRRSNSDAQIVSQGTEALTKEELERLYLVEKMTQTEIAQLHGVTQSSIKHKMQQHGIKTRSAHPGAANGMFGRTHTPEARAKIREANRKQFDDPLARERHALTTCKQIQDGKTGKAYNKLEQTVAALLDKAGVAYEQQYRIGRFLFDFFLPESNTLIEVHGTFWHADPRKYGNKPLSKIQQRNVANDVRKAERTARDGYKFVVLWEYDVYHSTNPLSGIAINGSP